LSGIIRCVLCGQIHELKIHAYLRRKVRDSETGKNRTIIIMVIMCPIAKELKKQYTKRILPPFLNPYCVISLDSTLAYLRLHPDGSMHRDLACQMMGTVDLRTVQRHIFITMGRISEAGLELHKFLSQIPSYAQIPPQRVGQTPLDSLEEAGAEVYRATVRVQGGSAARIPVQVYVYGVGVFQRARNFLAISLTLVLRAVAFHDTS
jgi:hypothetical protein